MSGENKYDEKQIDEKRLQDMETALNFKYNSLKTEIEVLTREVIPATRAITRTYDVVENIHGKVNDLIQKEIDRKKSESRIMEAISCMATSYLLAASASIAFFMAKQCFQNKK